MSCMKKTNKKLASAIVLGLMLAVPVGASAAVPEAVNGVITIENQERDNIGSKNDRNDIVFAEGISSWYGNDGSNIYANNVMVEKVADGEVTGGYKNLFYAGSGNELGIDAAGDIVVADGSTGIEVFHTMSGTLNVKANNINVIDSTTAVCAQTGGNDTGIINIEATNDIYLKTTDYKTVKSVTYNNTKTNTSTLDSEVNISAGRDLTIVNNGGGYAVVVEAIDYNNNNNPMATNGNEMNLTAGNTLTIQGIDKDGKTSEAILVQSNGTTGKGQSLTISAKDIVIDGNIDILSKGNVTIGDDKVNSTVIKGNITSKDANSKVDINLGTNGSLTGSVASDATSNVSIDLGEGSVWNVTSGSTEGGEVVTASSVGTLEGNGTVKIADTDVTEVKIGSVAGGSNITYGNTAAVTDTFKSAADAETYAAKFKVGDAGLKDATYKSDAGSVLGDIYVSYDGEGKATVTQKVNEDNQAISNMASIGLMAWRAENNDMNKRLGELRNSNGEHGVWARMVRGESEFGAQNVKNVYNTYQLGYDEKLSTNDNWTVGAAISYTDGQSSFENGSGENTSKGLSFYGSYLGDNGEFVDLIAKYARLDNEFDVTGGAGSGDYSTNGYSFSAEFGKRNQLANDFYFEPQVELTYGRVADVDYVTDKGVNVSQDSMDSLVGRVGFAAGKNIKNGNVYVRASYLYDFDGETNVTFVNDAGANTSFSEDLGGGWFEFGIGTNINLSDATYLYLDVEKTTGGEVDTNWQWNAGVRYSF